MQMCVCVCVCVCVLACLFCLQHAYLRSVPRWVRRRMCCVNIRHTHCYHIHQHTRTCPHAFVQRASGRTASGAGFGQQWNFCFLFLFIAVISPWGVESVVFFNMGDSTRARENELFQLVRLRDVDGARRVITALRELIHVRNDHVSSWPGFGCLEELFSYIYICIICRD